MMIVVQQLLDHGEVMGTLPPRLVSYRRAHGFRPKQPFQLE